MVVLCLSRVGVVVRALASHQCVPGSIPGFDSRRHMWVEFVVCSLLCSERFFSGYSGVPLFSNTNISKFQFDLDYCQALYHEPLARVIVQAVPVFDVKFTKKYITTISFNSKVILYVAELLQQPSF